MLLNDSADPDPETDLEVLVIEPRRRRGPFSVFRDGYLSEILHHRELLYFLVWRDVKVKYKMAALGIAWAVLVPLAGTLVYGLGGQLANLDRDVAVPYLLFMAAGMTPWTFLNRCVSDGGVSLVANYPLLSKIYLPRVYIPAAACGGAMVDLLIALGIAAVFALGYWVAGMFTPTWNLLALPLLLPLTFIAGLGTAILLGGLTLLYRDLRFLIPFFTQFGLWLSGVVIPLLDIGRWEWVLMFNPYAGIVSAWRSAICGTPWQPVLLLGSFVISPLLLWIGLAYFRGVERRFADIA